MSWLVRYHLLLSSTAFKRDLADPKTIEDFVHQVQSPERLRLLLILTVVDIRAVGPGVWNEWKRTLLRTLFEAAEERLRLGHKQHGRAELVEARQKELAAELGWKASAIRAHARRLPDSYWLAEPLGLASRQRPPGGARRGAHRGCQPKRRRSRTILTTAQRGSASSRLTARACSTAFAPVSPRRARTSSTRASTPRAMAWRSTICSCSMAAASLIPIDGCAAVLARSVERRWPPLSRRSCPSERERASQRRIRSRPFGRDRRPCVDPDDGGRGQRPRPARAARRLASAIHECGHRLHSAHIATYGERAVDVFYLTRADGRKLDVEDAEALRAVLLQAATTKPPERKPPESPARRARPAVEAEVAAAGRRRRTCRAGRDHRAVRARLHRRRRRKRRRWRRRRRRSRVAQPEFPADGYAERPGLAEVSVEQRRREARDRAAETGLRSRAGYTMP